MCQFHMEKIEILILKMPLIMSQFDEVREMFIIVRVYQQLLPTSSSVSQVMEDHSFR